MYVIVAPSNIYCTNEVNASSIYSPTGDRVARDARHEEDPFDVSFFFNINMKME